MERTTIVSIPQIRAKIENWIARLETDLANGRFVIHEMKAEAKRIREAGY